MRMTSSCIICSFVYGFLDEDFSWVQGMMMMMMVEATMTMDSSLMMMMALGLTTRMSKKKRGKNHPVEGTSLIAKSIGNVFVPWFHHSGM